MQAATALGRCTGLRAFRQLNVARGYLKANRLASTRTVNPATRLLQARVSLSTGNGPLPTIGAPHLQGQTGSVTAFAGRRFFSSDLPSHEVVGLPALSPTMEMGTISEWKVKEGESFSAGDIICLVQTDKATVDFEAQDEGVLAKILIPAGGQEAAVGTPMMVVVEDPGHVASFASFTAEGGDAPPAPAPAPAPAPLAPTVAPAPEPVAAPAPVAATTPVGGRVIASPLAKSLAAQAGHDISAIRGTGPGGRVIAADVREFVPSLEDARLEASMEGVPGATTTAAGVAAPPRVSPDGVFTDYPVSVEAAAIAARLTISKQTVPHYYLTVDIKLDNILEVRKKLNQGLPEGQELSLNDMLLKAAALATTKVPDVNASWMETFVRQYSSFDVNLVVGVGNGLVAPVVRNVGGRGIKSISDEIRSLSAQAAAGELQPHQVEMGTLTVANLGAYGVKNFAPIVHSPQACVLAIGAAEERVIPNEDPESEEIYQITTMLSATVSCDHRVVDGAVSAQWLAEFRGLVENPLTLLL